MYFNYNQEISNQDSFNISTLDRAFRYGDGLFETIRYSNNRLNFFEKHYFRLMASMRILRMEIPMSFTPEFIEEEILKTLTANGLDTSSARVRFQVCRKAGGKYAPITNDVDFLIQTEALDHTVFELNEDGLNLDVFKDYYKQKSLLSNLKLSSCTIYTLASIYKKENNLDDLILLNDEKHIAEAISSNLFIRKGKQVFTPALSEGCVRGVIREKVIEILEKSDFEIIESKISPFEVQKADELFLTNTIKGIQWVGQFKKKSFEPSLCIELVDKLNAHSALV